VTGNVRFVVSVPTEIVCHRFTYVVKYANGSTSSTEPLDFDEPEPPKKKRKRKKAKKKG
jgi:hypothetical protein